jgi:hypothetical protein
VCELDSSVSEYRPVTGCFEQGNESSGSTGGGGICQVVQPLLSSQEGLSSIEEVNT